MMVDQSILSGVYEGILTKTRLCEYFDNLEANARDVEIIVAKGCATVHGEECEWTLSECKIFFLNRSVRGVQLRYLYQHSEWWDTLMWTQRGMKLVRIHHCWESGG